MKRRTKWLAWSWFLFLGGCLAGKLDPLRPFFPGPEKKTAAAVAPLPASPRSGPQLPDDIRQFFSYPAHAGQKPNRHAQGLILSQLVFRGAALGDLTYHIDSSVLPAGEQPRSNHPFGQITLIGSIPLASGPLAGDPPGAGLLSPAPEPVPLLVTVPEPAIHALALAAALGWGFRRSRA